MNCLVTKLKAVVDNDSLKKLGEIRIKVNIPAGTQESDRTMHINVNSEGGGSVSLIGTSETFKVVNSSNPEINKNYTIFSKDVVPVGRLFGDFTFPVGAYEISIMGVSNIEYIGNIANSSLDISQFNYCKYLTSISAVKTNAFGEYKPMFLDSIKSISLKDYGYNNSTAYMNIDNIAKSKIIETLYLYDTANKATKSFGSINNLHSPKLKQILIVGSNISGELETLAQNMIEAGVEEGHRLYVQAIDSKVTMKGKAFKDAIVEHKENPSAYDVYIKFSGGSFSYEK